jgi:5-methylcytosine-specific restriction endonuclease McrA
VASGLIRAGLFGPVLPAALTGWLAGHEPGHLGGLAALTAVALIAVPVLLTAISAPPGILLAHLVPRRWRIRYRYRRVPRRLRSKFPGQDSIPRAAQHSSYISARLRRKVIAAERGRCIACRKKVRGALQPDHLCPWSGGGFTWIFNLFGLCPDCNRVKLNYWKDNGGYRHYRREFRNGKNLDAARKILAAERRHRLNVFRWLRACWAL